VRYWLQFDRDGEQVEGALLNGGELRIEQEAVFWTVGHRHCVAGDGGEVGEEGLEAVDWKVVVGALAGGLLPGLF